MGQCWDWLARYQVIEFVISVWQHAILSDRIRLSHTLPVAETLSEQGNKTNLRLKTMKNAPRLGLASGKVWVGEVGVPGGGGGEGGWVCGAVRTPENELTRWG